MAPFIGGFESEKKANAPPKVLKASEDDNAMQKFAVARERYISTPSDDLLEEATGAPATDPLRQPQRCLTNPSQPARCAERTRAMLTMHASAVHTSACKPLCARQCSEASRWLWHDACQPDTELPLCKCSPGGARPRAAQTP